MVLMLRDAFIIAAFLAFYAAVLVGGRWVAGRFFGVK